MLEKEMIQLRGFKNVFVEGDPAGFQVRIRTPYYRGIWASLLEGAEVTVDGEKFAKETIQWTLGEKMYTLAELEASTDLRWQFDEAAVLTVPRPGGLATGTHDIKVSLFFRASYMPENMQPWVEHTQRSVTLVH